MYFKQTPFYLENRMLPSISKTLLLAAANGTVQSCFIAEVKAVHTYISSVSKRFASSTRTPKYPRGTVLLPLTLGPPDVASRHLSISNHHCATTNGNGHKNGNGRKNGNGNWQSAAYQPRHFGGRKIIKPIADLKNQTVELEDGGRICCAYADEDDLLDTPFEDVHTLYEAFRRGARETATGQCLGWRPRENDKLGPYRWISYAEALRRIENIAAGFAECGLPPGQQSFVGIFSANRPEWVLTEQATYVRSMVNVPLYDTLGIDACTRILQQAEIKLVVCDKLIKVEALLTRKNVCPQLTHLVLMESTGVTDSIKQNAKGAGICLLTLSELEQMGERKNKESRIIPQPPSPSDLCTICYTSGTTGQPKGVMLTHGNVIADCTVLFSIRRTNLDRYDCMMSYLPMAHMFERQLQTITYLVGAKVGFYAGDVKQLLDDLGALHPTLMPAVPQILNRVYEKVTKEVEKSPPKRFMLMLAMYYKRKELEKGIVSKNTIWDKIVFRKVREAMGDNLRILVSGSAPLAPEVLTFMRAALGCVVLEGYGQTECVAAATCSLEGDHSTGHVGVPLPCCKIKLIDIPEMDYYAKNNEGEVCIKGKNVFQGYYKDPVTTAQALDSDGWLHTGDVGQWTANKTLRIINRKRNIFKLANGEFIDTFRIETVYNRSILVAQCCVYGDSLKSWLVAIVVPDEIPLKKFAQETLNLKNLSFAELCQNEKVKEAVYKDILKEGLKAGLPKFELVRNIYLHNEPFSVESGVLTPTLKLKRSQLHKVFGKQIAELYQAKRDD